MQKRKQPNNATLLRHRRILSADGVNYNIAEAPLYFVRSGWAVIALGELWGAGFGGDIWSSCTSLSAPDYAYNLGFNLPGVAPSGDYTRYGGFPLRCILEKN